MEHSVYYNKSVDDVIQQYFRKLRIRILLGMLLAFVDAIIFIVSWKWWVILMENSNIIHLWGELTVCQHKEKENSKQK